MSLRDHINLDGEGRRLDEEILNVIRRSEAGFVGTSEVTESPSVDRTIDTVRKHLFALEEDGRVHSKRLGDPENGNLAWYLDESERQRPVEPDRYWIARVCEEGRGIGNTVLVLGAVLALTGSMVLLMALSADMLGIQFSSLKPGSVGPIGFAIAVGGFTNLFIGGSLKWGLTVTETVIERRATPVP